MLKEVQSPSQPPQRGGEVTSKFKDIRFVRWLSSSPVGGRAGGAFFFFLLFLFCTVKSNYAQVRDTTSISSKPIEQPNSTSTAKVKVHSPKKAALLSTIIPGSGQVYNKKYWKVPIIYAGLIGLAYSFDFNQSRYVKYRNAYKVRLTNGPGTVGNYPRYSDESLDILQKFYGRYRNLTVIGGTLLYVMNILDACVDAHMFTFDVGDDLSFNLHPALINTANVNSYTTGLSLNIKF